MSPVEIGNIPSALLQLRQWCVWRMEKPEKEGAKWKKMPRTISGGHGDSTNPARWVTGTEAYDAFVASEKGNNPFNGIGFVFYRHGPRYTGLDFDGWTWDKVQPLVADLLPAYVELSQSGNGVHVIVRGTLPPAAGNGKKDSEAGIEVYHDERYFAITGNVPADLPKPDLETDRTAALAAFYEKHLAHLGGKRAGTEQHPLRVMPLDEQALIDRILPTRDGKLLNKLFYSGEPNEQKLSEADFDLACILCRATGDDDLVECVMLQSALRREKWEAHRTYLRGITIRNARVANPVPAATGAVAEPVLARTFADIWADPDALKLRDAVIPRIAWRGRVTAYSAPDKGGKSTLLSAGMVALATGQLFLGEVVHPSVSIWCLLEEHPGDFLPRVHAMGSPGAQLVVFEQRPTIEDIRREIVERQAAVVVFDTLIEWAGDRVTETGQTGQWAPIMRELRTLARELNVAVVLLHHARRSDGKAADSRHITAQCDVVLEQLKLPKDTASGCQEIVVRGRWIMGDFKVRLVDGKRCELVAGGDADSAKPTGKPSPEEKKVLAALMDGLTWAEWKAGYVGDIADKDKRKSKGETFKTCARRLVDKKLVHPNEEAGTYSIDQFGVTQEQAA